MYVRPGKFMVTSSYHGPECKTMAQNSYSGIMAALTAGPHLILGECLCLLYLPVPTVSSGTS